MSEKAKAHWEKPGELLSELLKLGAILVFGAELAHESLRDIGIAYRSQPHGPADMTVNTSMGGRFVYWSEPDGHVWEALTESYARQPASWGDPAHDSEMD